MRTRALVVALVLCAVPAAATAEAGRDEARERFSRGQELYRAGDYQAALVEFQAAYDAAPHPVVLKSMADCQEQLRNYGRAVELLERYLADRPDAPDRAAVEARIAGHRARPASLRIVTDPPGAQVTLDGTRLSEPTPVTVEVRPGSHAAAIELEGYQMAIEELEIGFAEARTVELDLAPIGAPPEGAEVPTPVGEGGEGGEGGAGRGAAGETGPGVRISTPVWIMTGLAGAGLLTGIISGSLALADQGEFDDAVGRGESRDQLESIGDAGRAKALVADIAFGVAAAAAITGIILFFVENARREPEHEARGVSITPSVAGDGGGISATLRF